MDQNIQQLITACEWYASHFLIFSENVYTPLLYYSYFGALIPSALIALFVFFSNPKKLPNKILLMMVGSFAMWIFLALILWAHESPSMIMFAWSMLNLFEPLVYFFALYFAYVMFFERDFSISQKILFSLPLLVTFIFTPTHYGLIGFNLIDCGRNVYEGIVATYGYVIEFLYILLIIGFFGYFLMITKDAVLRKKATLITTGIVLFLLSFSAGNILEVFTENWLIGQYGLFGAPIFVAFLAYSMVKYKTFNTKILGTQVLVVGLWIAVLSMLFVRSIENVRYVVLVTLLLVTVFGYQLIKSVLQIEQQKVSLQKANEQQQALMRFINHQVKGFFTRSRIIFDSLKNGEYGKLPPEAADLVKVGFDTNTEGVQMVKSLLDAANLHDGTVQYKKVRLDFRALVSDIAGQVREMAISKGLTFDVVATDQVFIFGDLTHLAQAVRNMIENAIQYTEKGVVSVTLRIQSGNAVLTISDSGLGLTPEDRARLFKQGGRGEEATRRNVNSTGYGLYITKQIVKAHNGTIDVASAGRDKGSTFTVSIPITTE